MWRAGLIAVGLLLSAQIIEAAEPPKAPAPPPATVPDLPQANFVAFCVTCDQPFDMTVHQQLLAGLVTSPYNAELRKALFSQDVLHQFESRAHFDNCDFDDATAYLSSLLMDMDRDSQAAQAAKASGNDAAARAAVTRAFFSLGQALHGVQDFYAHTNYVELQVPAVKRVTDLEILAPWRPEGRERIAQLQTRGLVSGFVFWGFPQKCPSGSISHADLAKDSADTKSGKKLVAHLQNLSNYRIAFFLAREASLNLVRDVFKRWPLLQDASGPNLGFEVLLERRSL